MKKRPKKHEEHADEGWLLPYSDMLTLLLALFIVMFAMAKTDDGKLDELSNEFSVILSGKNNGSDNGILPGQQKKTPSDSKENKKSKKSEKTKVVEKPEKSQEEKKMQAAGDSIKDELSKAGHAEDIDVDLEQDGLRIAIKSGLLFSSGSADITGDVEDIVKKVADSLKDLDNDLIVAGYTDNVPSNTTEFPSNWELSSARAMTVMKLLVKHQATSEDRISVQAYGEFKPKVPNNNDENRASNRRVEIFIIKKDKR
ncbi:MULTISPECIES: flagellar motor protein MotB [Vagococcus]|uniref:Flagellar motor rotation protein MotB n=1 Tax=Vagococcus fluvialis bH819 TaxID=1255619 RepID=A0A1X6WRA3_9ENTE|nr:MULTISPECIES: flagellar motor protein MotB [Vagococcus]SLM86873.1 Flagellar motor rotation protein MotB [Vagococcus fluvialis bH819]HCM88670.1 hypothetical protein [Vagococcus sp.]